MSRNTSRDHTQQLDPGIEPAVVVERILRVSERQQNFQATDHCCCAFGEHPAPQRRKQGSIDGSPRPGPRPTPAIGTAPRSNACREQQGASLDRPALQNLLADVRAGEINTEVVYKGS